MRDLDKLLRNSLREAGDAFAPAREAEARRAFLHRARRRRLYAGGSLALAGAGVAAVVFILSAGEVRSPAPKDGETAAAPSGRVVARVEVGDSPLGVAIGRDSVWVANSGDGTLSRIDPDTNEVVDSVDIGGTPVEVAVAGGSVWVALDDEPRLVAVDAGTLETREVALSGGGTNLDVASGGGHLWVVSPDTPLQRIDSGDFTALVQTTSVSEPVDIAVGGGKVWVLGAEGAIDQIDMTSGLGPEATFTLDSPVSPSASDLASDGVSLWISDGDTRTIVRLDVQTSVVTAEVPFRGRFADLAAGPGELWALVGNDTPRGSLLRIDTGTGLADPEPITIGGHPADLAAGDGTLWAVSRSSDRLTRADVGARPSAPAAVAGEALPDDEVLYVFAHAGDLALVGGDGGVEAVTSSSEDEVNPSFIADDTIVLERTDAVTGLTHLVTLDLETGAEETTPVSGTEVAVGPEGRVAWVLSTDDPSEQTQIRIGSLDGSGDDFFVANPRFEPLPARNLEWDPSGNRLYYEAGSDANLGLYEADAADPSPRAIDPPEEGASYLGPSITQEGEAIVLKRCCHGAGGYQTVELGRITLERGARAYSKIAGLDDAGFDPNAHFVTVEFAGGLDVETTAQGRVWTDSSVRAWIVSDGSGAWLVDEESEIDRLDSSDVTGVAVNPDLLD
ncbi:MAG: hypothetical protein ACRDK3_08840 [Actinomycetota bacterium]